MHLTIHTPIHSILTENPCAIRVRTLHPRSMLSFTFSSRSSWSMLWLSASGARSSSNFLAFCRSRLDGNIAERRQARALLRRVYYNNAYSISDYTERCIHNREGSVKPYSLCWMCVVSYVWRGGSVCFPPTLKTVKTWTKNPNSNSVPSFISSYAIRVFHIRQMRLQARSLRHLLRVLRLVHVHERVVVQARLSIALVQPGRVPAAVQVLP